MFENGVPVAVALAAESEVWFLKTLKSHNAAPRTFTGITRSGYQFMTYLDEVQWTQPEHIKRRAFLIWLCRRECVAAYSYATLMALDDGSYFIEIVADDGDNIANVSIPMVRSDSGLSVFEESKLHLSRDQDRKWHPYTRLMELNLDSGEGFEAGDEEVFEKWWEVLRSSTAWRSSTIKLRETLQ